MIQKDFLEPEEKIENLCLNILDIIRENRYLRKRIKEQEEAIKMYRDDVDNSLERYNEMIGNLLTSFMKGGD